MKKRINKSIRKMLLMTSLSGVLMGCSTTGQSPGMSSKKYPKDTFSAEQIPLEDLNIYFNTERNVQEDSPESYKKDMLFTRFYAEKQNKMFFEFDGTTYKTDETALQQIDALVKARQKGQKTYIFDGKEKETCSYYPPESQLKIFGNLWEEVRSPQSEETKKVVRDFIEDLIFPCWRIDALNRVYEILRLSGYPEIKSETTDQSLIGKLIEKNSQKKRSHYEPATLGRSTIYLVPKKINFSKFAFSTEDFLGELAHAFRDNNNRFGETAQFFGDALKDITTFNSLGFGNEAQGKNYKNKDRMEYDTHEVVQPLLKKYIKGLIQTLPELYAEIEKTRHKNKNTYMLTSSASEKAQKGKNKPSGFSVPVFGYSRIIKDK